MNGAGSFVAQDAVLQVSKDACASAERQYEDYYKTFTALDTKAQTAGTVGGVVMAAVVAFINAPRLSPTIPKALILATTALALLTVILSLCVSWVRSTAVPYAAEEQIAEAEDLASLAGEQITADHVLRYYRGRLEYLSAALSDIDSGVRAKGGLLLAAQLSLAATLVVLMVLFFKIVS